MRRLLGVSAVVLLTCAAAAARPSQVDERVRVAEAGQPVTATLPPGVFLVLASPPDYARQSSGGTTGSWVGPEYRATGGSGPAGRARIEWMVRFEAGAKKTDEAATAALGQGWKDDFKGGISIPHLVGRRTVGTLDGDFVHTQGWREGEAVREAAMAFPLAPRLLVLVNFVAPEPAMEDAGAQGQYQVNSLPASLWNRGQMIRALSGVRVEGNLPPTRVTISAAGSRLRGTVGDAFRHPLVGARVSVERLAGGWRKAATTRTDARGEYAVRVGRRGRYRAVVTLGKTTAISPTALAR